MFLNCVVISFVQMIKVAFGSCGWTNNNIVIDTDFNDVIINEGIIEQSSDTSNVFICQRLCLRNPECVSFFTNKPNRTCRLLGVRLFKIFVEPTQLIDDVSARYFFLEDPERKCTDYYWDRLDNKCYRFFTDLVSFQQARLNCINMGESLLIPESLAFNERLKRQLKANAKLNAASYWIDGTDQATEGTWRWGDGTVVNYNNWRPGYPRNQTENNDFLLMVKANNWGWMDVLPDITLRKYICERNIF